MAFKILIVLKIFASAGKIAKCFTIEVLQKK